MRNNGTNQRSWDYIIVGTGMGGAVLGHALAKAGNSVLFCESGLAQAEKDNSLAGDYAELFFKTDEGGRQSKEERVLLHAGRRSEPIVDRSGNNEVSYLPFLGNGLGGSTAIYGMALERFFPEDFEPRSKFPQDTESTLPERWPIQFNELEQYYEKAEALFRVRGTEDPLKSGEHFNYLDPPVLHPGNQELFSFFENKRLNPYQLPLAFENVKDCDYCSGYLCDKNCKNDSFRICLKPALKDFGAKMLSRTKVLSLVGDKGRVTGLIAMRDTELVTLRARNYVLAAGALETPRILLASASTSWPTGAANSSGLVGKNLMRHLIDLYFIPVKSPINNSRSLKQLAFNDFYVGAESKWGTVQSFGVMPPAELVYRDLKKDIELKSSFLAWSLQLGKPLIKYHLARLFSRTLTMASIMEDLPYESNSVSVKLKDPDGIDNKIILNYSIHNHELKRLTAFRQKLHQIFQPYEPTFVKNASDNKMLAHACGTCRFGEDPKASVLNKYNRAHDLQNLYIVDSSFFPSSSGTNPSLTLAANALRVAHHLLEEKD